MLMSTAGFTITSRLFHESVNCAPPLLLKRGGWTNRYVRP